MSFRFATLAALTISCCFVLLFASQATAQNVDEYKQRVKDSLSKLAQTNKDKQWAYKRTTEQGKDKERQITIESFDPSKQADIQWTLISDNGKTPTTKEQQSYRNKQLEKARQAEEAKKAQDKDEEQTLTDMVKFDSLKLIEQNDSQALLSFIPQLKEMGEDSHKHLKGTITFDKRTNQVSQLLIENTADLNPALSVTLKQFSMSFKLIYLEQSLLPQQINIDIYGKAAVFTTIDQKTQETYSDYQHKGTQKP